MDEGARVKFVRDSIERICEQGFCNVFKCVRVCNNVIERRFIM